MAGEEEATCPTCSLIVRVIYDVVSAVSYIKFGFIAGHVTNVSSSYHFIGIIMCDFVLLQEAFKASADEVELDSKLKNLKLETN